MQVLTCPGIPPSFFSGGGGSGAFGYDGTVKAVGSGLVNGGGRTLQLRGVNFGAWGTAVITNTNQPGGGVSDLSAGTYQTDQAFGPNLTYFQQWKTNCVRLGAPNASWLGYTCYVAGAVNGDGVTGVISGDPNGDYKAKFIAEVAALNAIGCYVIIVCAFTNPGRSATLGQDVTSNQDNDIQYWQSMAQTFGYPNGTALKRNGGTVDDHSVIFELWNEAAAFGDSVADWQMQMNGGFYTNSPYAANSISGRGGSYRAVFCWPVNTPTGTFVSGEPVTITGGITATFFDYYVNTTTGYSGSGSKMIHMYTMSSTALAAGATITGTISGATTTITSTTQGFWAAGMADLLSAVRGTGAQNVCLMPGINYNQDLGLWATYAPTDSTAPAGYSGPGWVKQIGASWHPYPAYSYITAATPATGGSGYAVNDTILLPMDESGGPNSGNCYWQSRLTVTSVSGSSITGLAVNTALSYGIPGVSGATSGQFNNHEFNGGVWCNLVLPANPLGQYSSSGAGTGATFNVTFTIAEGDSGTGFWPNYSTWAQVAALKTTPGVPVVITEVGEHAGTGIVGAPWMSAMTSWCDSNNISLLCYSYNPTPGWYNANGSDYALALSSTSGSGAGTHRTPTPGYGQFMYNWFTTHSP